ncbi:holocytochrome c synthase [Thoreauomyces humboldtii]|nr:holocytochrome c synthase [Thoreauomyces humboldtii]
MSSTDHPSKPSSSASSSQGSCPVDHTSFAGLSGKAALTKPPGHPSATASSSSNSTGGGCPVDHGKGGPAPGGLNPLNMMPKLSQDAAQGQEAALPTNRTQSSIPRSDDKSTWEYPSPQQFYNALVRKGYETPVKEITTMVDIHNFLNEACWDEVRKWEKKYHCDCKDLKLKKFQGRPQDLTPKARMYSWFGVDKPFDRHDWTVDRCGEDVRYVIDYYSSPDEAPGMPVFNVDVRPALDSPSAIFDRARMGAQRMWEKVFGGAPEDEE